MKRILLGLMVVLALLMSSAMVSATGDCGPKCRNFTTCCDATVTTYADEDREIEQDEFEAESTIYATLDIAFTGYQIPWCTPEYCRDNSGRDKLRLGLNDSDGNIKPLGHVRNFVLPSWSNTHFYKNYTLNTTDSYYDIGAYDFIFGGVTGFWHKCGRRFGPLIIGGFSIVPELTAVGALAAVAVIGFAYMRKQKGQ